MKGTIKSLKADKMFGFILGLDNKEYFFHRDSFHGFWNDLVNDYERKGKDPIVVSFEPTMGPKGKRAEEVRRLDNGAPMEIEEK